MQEQQRLDIEKPETKIAGKGDQDVKWRKRKKSQGKGKENKARQKRVNKNSSRY